MAITKLTVENFKSFDKLEVELRPFNIVVGSNASGKSNFLDVFRFLRDIADDSLRSAVGLRGGGEALRNFNLDTNEILRICVETDDIQRHLVGVGPDGVGVFGMERNRTIYELSIKFDESDTGFEVIMDRMTEQFRLLELGFAEGEHDPQAILWDFGKLAYPESVPPLEFTELRDFGPGEALHQHAGGLFECFITLPDGVPLSDEDIGVVPGNVMSFGDHHEVILERTFRPALLPGAANSLVHISAYDFDPRKARQAVPPTGSQVLDPSAENLSVVLREILRRPESNIRLINLVSELLPFVRGLEVEEFGFGHLIMTLTERFSDKGYRLPAAFASDGTIACLALVIALYFQESAVAIFEEPDRHIHPHLSGRVMQLMNEVTDEMQVIVTTHNPELLRHANLEDILLVTRDSDGHSQVTRPSDSEVVRHFLQSELGVEDLFTQDLLAL